MGTAVKRLGDGEQLIAGQCEGFPQPKHVDCGGDLWTEGEGWVQFPVGLGFREHRGHERFVVDCGRYKTYVGFCERCKAEGHFVRLNVKPKLVTRTPRLKKRKD